MTGLIDLRDPDTPASLHIVLGPTGPHEGVVELPYAQIVHKETGHVLLRTEYKHAQMILTVLRAHTPESMEALMRLLVAAFPDVARAILDLPPSAN